jgi:hypothetical protein
MQNIIPSNKRVHPGNGIHPAKKIVMYPPSAVPGAGFKSTLDPAKFNPRDENNIPGQMKNSSSEMFETELALKIAIVNTLQPENNRFIDSIPQGAPIFIRAPVSKADRYVQSLDVGGIIDYSDQLACVQFEFLNYHMHLLALDVKSRKGQALTLEDVMRTWKPFGLCDTKPVPSFYNAPEGLVAEVRWIKTLQRSRTKMPNIFGTQVAGQQNSYLWFKLIEENTERETAYVLGTDPKTAPTFYLTNQVNNADEVEQHVKEEYGKLPQHMRVNYSLQQAIAENKTVGFVPKLVPYYTDKPELSDKDRQYFVTLADGTIVERKGFFISEGRVLSNPEYKPSIMHNRPSEKSAVYRNMTRSHVAARGKLLDVVTHMNGRWM